MQNQHACCTMLHTFTSQLKMAKMHAKIHKMCKIEILQKCEANLSHTITTWLPQDAQLMPTTRTQ